ncbi:hypothetical protein LTR08_001457 [Meristemomyces frigidus]|nr:hypothetical protein LTR08_001457 [Meristemomyces frigidus]
MSVTRVRALRSLQSSLRHGGARATPRASAPVRTQLAVGRRYASEGGHGHAEPTSDIPWLIGAIAVTIPTCWFLWPSSSHADSGHHGGHEEHAESHEEGEAAEAEDDKPEPQEEPETKDESEMKDESAQDTTQEHEEAKESEETAKPSGTMGESQPASTDANKVSGKDEEAVPKETPDRGGDTDDAKFKGQMKPGSDGNTDTRKREPDSKGAYKKRIDSGLGKDLGEGDAYDEENGDGPKTESVSASRHVIQLRIDTNSKQSATSKPAQKGKAGEISSKQFGISSTPTRHSTQLDEDPEKSKKGEGTPETAKAMGTVSVDRPAR